MFLDHLYQVCFWITFIRYVSGSPLSGMFLNHLYQVCFWITFIRYVSGSPLSSMFLDHLYQVCSVKRLESQIIIKVFCGTSIKPKGLNKIVKISYANLCLREIDLTLKKNKKSSKLWFMLLYGDIIYSVIFFSECDICDKYIRG